MNMMEQILADMRQKKASGINTTIVGCGCAAMPPELPERSMMEVRKAGTAGTASKSKNLMQEIMEEQKRKR